MEGKAEISDFTKKDSQALKGDAILMMLFHHLYLSSSLFGAYEVDFSPFTEDSVVVFSLYLKICVSVFVFISGYGLTKAIKAQNENYTLSKLQFKTYIRTRLIKLLSGYWFVYICVFIFSFIMDNRPFWVYFNGRTSYADYSEGIVHMIIEMLGLTGIFGYTLWNDTLNGGI